MNVHDDDAEEVEDVHKRMDVSKNRKEKYRKKVVLKY